MTKTISVPLDLLRQIEQRLRASGNQPAAQQLAPVLQNATNSEPWYRSRIFIGITVAAAGYVGSKIGLVVTEGDITELVNIIAALVEAGGLAYAWYGRVVGASKKPLGK